MSVYEETEGPPRLSWDMWKKFLLGGILVIALTATAVASGVLLQVHETIAVFQHSSTPIPGIKNELDAVEPGSAQFLFIDDLTAKVVAHSSDEKFSFSVNLRRVAAGKPWRIDSISQAKLT